MTAAATTTRTIAALQAAGFEVTESAPYGQTVEFVARHSDLRGCVLAVSKRGGRIVRASMWLPREREQSVRGTSTDIARVIRQFAA